MVGSHGGLAKMLHQTVLEMGDRYQMVNAHCPDCMVYRLVFGGLSADGCFVCFSAIGLFPSFEIVAFDTKTQKPRPLWAARGAFVSPLAELQSSVAEGQFHPLPTQ